MTQTPSSADNGRPPYATSDYPAYGGHGAQQSPQRQEPPREESRSAYPPPPDAGRPPHGQYAPPPQTANAYPPPQQWAGQPHGGYPPPPHHYDPNQQAYHYPPPPDGQASQSVYRLPPPYPPAPHGYYAPPHYPQQPAPAPRQRTAIACKYCRKRKIRCSGYDSSPDGRCANCVRFNQQCLFHPVSSQAAFVPASAVYGPNARAPLAGQGDGRDVQNGQAQQPMLYGAHGQPLGPAGPGGQPAYSYPPPTYPTQPYGYPPPAGFPLPPHPQAPQYEHPPTTGHQSSVALPHSQNGQYEHAQSLAHRAGSAVPPPQAADADGNHLKRGVPDEDPHNEAQVAQSPHPTSRARRSGYGGRQNSNGSFDYHDGRHAASTSPATATMTYQSSYPAPHGYVNGNGVQSGRGTNSPPGALTPQSGQTPGSGHSYNSDGRTSSPNPTGAGGAAQGGQNVANGQNGRSGLSVHEMLGNHGLRAGPSEQQRGKNDNEMLSKLDKKR